jgi:deazaflavin-dependent oxidoreductase (nitroreductase family)
MGLGVLMSHSALGGNKMLVLTSWGRVSGKPRHTMLSYVFAQGKEYVCSGWGANTDWYKNILADPQVTVQVGRKTYSATAYRVEDINEFTKIAQELFETGGDSHFEDWLKSYGIEVTQEDMISKRDRLYLVGFDENDDPAPSPMSADLKWVWGLIVLFFLVIWLIII